MRTLASAVILFLSAMPALAQNTCDAQAAERKLAGAAKASFLKKCNADAVPAAQAACDAKATEKQLAGAAKTSFTKKCVREAIAAKKSASGPH